MSQQPLETFKMETNFEGLIQLLAKHLYPEPDVFVRELIQNAHDSIQRRRQSEPDLAGSIDIRFEGNQMIFRDNGIGMDRDDIKAFLSVIGSTGTGTARKQLMNEGRSAAFELIGQFGIGMLSAFVVAEKVIVRTRKVGEEQAFAWHNAGSTDCILYADDKQDVGTEIAVITRPDYAYMLDEKRLRETIVKYCDFIPFPVKINGFGPVNAADAPWHRRHWPSEEAKKEAYTAMLMRRYPDMPLDIIPIELDEPYPARGALYISDRRIPDYNTAGVMDIFVRRMFVRANDNEFLPPWAKFVRGIIDSPALQPTAARDNIQRNEDAYRYFQEKLGELIVQRLTYLAEFEPIKFQKINLWHHYHLKGMAVYHDDFFQKVADLLIFDTNRGQVALREYLAMNEPRQQTDNKPPIYYFAHESAAAQFFRLADARGWVVIHPRSRLDEELLEKYAGAHTVFLERLDASDDPDLFERLNDADSAYFRQLELNMEGHLRRRGVLDVLVQIRRFAPKDLPAVLILTPEQESDEKMRQLLGQTWMIDGMEDIAREALQQTRQRPKRLALNADNPLIEALASMEQHNPRVVELMHGIFSSALLYGHNTLTAEHMQAVHTQFVGVLNHLLESHQEIAYLEGRLGTQGTTREE